MVITEDSRFFQQTTSIKFQLIIDSLLYHQHYMSFFDLAQKQLESPPRQKHSLGPGYYKIQQRSKDKHSYAPFGSLTSKKQRKSMDNTLGPGYYEVRGEIIKPSISKYQNRNIIIVKINNDGGHQFKSKTNRFKPAQQSIVGPGHYKSQQSHRRTKSTSMKSPNINDKIRKINKEHFLKNQPTLTSDPLQFEDELPQKLPTKVKGVVSWGLNQKERFSIDAKQQMTSQDKQRALSQLIHSKQNKVRPSAVFASKSIKSHIETQIYKTNNSFKAELRKMINFKDDQPGPGTYEIHHQASLKTPKKFQFFGSTAERFPQASDQSNVGPGHYVIKDKSLHVKQNDYIYERQGKEDRHSYIPTNTTDLGPGSYEIKCDIVQSLSQNKFTNPFGSAQPRFHQQKPSNEQNPVPRMQTTSYCQEKRAKKELQIVHRKNILEHHPYAIFASNSKRFKQSSQEVKVGDYDVTQNDISTKVIKYQKLAKQLEQCQLIKPPFLSSQQRFKNHKTEQCQHKDCWCLIKSVEKQALQRESSAFACKQRREVFQSNDTPPVGYYDNNSKGILKGSFNSRFRKKNENHIKRDNLLRRGRESRYQGAQANLQPINSFK